MIDAPLYGRFEAGGIASFDPVDCDPRSPGCGRIAGTPKPGWIGTDLAGPFGDGFGCPMGFDTDVNGAILAESLWDGGVLGMPGLLDRRRTHASALAGSYLAPDDYASLVGTLALAQGACR